MSGLSVPGFEVLETIRQSSKTVTVKAVQHSLDRTVVLTFLRPELAPQPNEVRRFLGIARVCSQLKAQGLPQIYDIVSDADRHYIVMEFVEGPSLASLVSQKGPMAATQSVRIAFTVAEALDHAWQQSRLVHRNLKPSEIRIDARGTPKLTDFGRATVVPPDGRIVDDEDAGLIVGTPNFLSPEQAQGDVPLDCRADMYALGATLYYMVTGRVPFPDSDPETVIRKQITDQIPHPRTFRSDLPATVGGLITRLMMKLPEDRYSTWSDAMGDMQHVLKGLPLRRRNPPKSISTVAAPTTEAPTPDAARLRRTEPAAGPAAPANARAARHSGPPQALRTALWMGLGLWFALLANDRLGNPAKLPLPSPLIPIATWEAQIRTALSPEPAPLAPPAATVAPTPPAATVVAPPAAAGPAADSATPAPGAPATAQAVPATPNAIVPAPLTPAPEKSALPRELPAEYARRLTSALKQGDLDGARAMLAVSVPMDAAKLAEFRAALQAIPDPLRLAEDTLLRARGQETTVTYMGKERRIIPRSVANGEIQADFVSAEGTRPVTFKTAKFTPDELLKLLPPEPDSPAAQAACCIALLKANRPDDVATRRAACGILAPLFAPAAP